MTGHNEKIQNGTVLVEDIIGCEHSERLEYLDRFERLRDPSHTHTLALSALFQLFRETGLEAETAIMNNDLTPEVERWMATTKTPPDRAALIREPLEDDRKKDSSGTQPFQDATGRRYFHQRIAIITGRKFR